MADLDPDTFDLTGWLAGHDPDEYRPRQTVTVYLIQPGLKDELDRLREEHTNRDAAVKRAETEKLQRSVAEPSANAHQVALNRIEARMAELIEQVDEAKREITIIGMINPEVEAATADIERKDAAGRTYALLAASARVDGKRVTVDGLKALHSAIGQGQWQQLVNAFNEATYGDPTGGVTAPFSPRS
ncbi:hypothetical protein [Citricoccus sp. K5]|uniref:hypothetical protein n=1 Tax=Citricoccus sp. K5 TaxID=2653135 RepID=UPI0012F42F3C|nr:hypothetical protein [Citricoccus sp. K5]VXA92312.1 hypothetical protein CITRIK5_100015 [Citricoccus sp. K5]VXA94322.1 hypothetical protein CITRIK5_100081 [Citricoccus sp. K5]